MFTACAHAQPAWFKSYDLIPGGFPPNSDIGLQITPSVSGGFLMISGTLYNNNTTNSFGLYRLDEQGNEIFKRPFLNDENPLRAFGQDVMLELPNGEILITGDQFTGNTNDWYRVFLLKLSASGDSLWMRTYDSFWLDIPKAVVQTPDGGFLIQGSGGAEGTCCRDLFLIKTDAEGNLLWQRTLGLTNEFRYSISGNFLLFDDGSLLIPFLSAPYGDSKAYAYLLKTDTSGNRLWLKRMYRHVITEGPPKLRKLPDGNLVMITVVDTIMPPYYNPFVVFLTKIDTSGNKIWEVKYEWPGSYLYFGNIEVTSGGDILIGGAFVDSEITAWISKVSADGQKLWEKTYKRDLPVQLNFVIYDIAECPDGGIIVSGLGQDPVEGATYTDGNAWVMKVDSNGCFYPDNCEAFTLITSVADVAKPEAPNIRVFPNPTPGEIFVALPQGLAFAELAVYDALGRQVLRRRVAHNESVHLPDRGFYYFAFFREAALIKSVKVLRR